MAKSLLRAQLGAMKVTDGDLQVLAGQVVKTVSNTELIARTRKAIEEKDDLNALRRLEKQLLGALHVFGSIQRRELKDALRDLQIKIGKQVAEARSQQLCGV